MTVIGRSGAGFAVLALSLMAGLPASAANRFTVESKDLVIGQTGQTITLQCDNDFAVYGFSIGVKYEIAKIQITAADLATDTAGAEWKDLKFNNTTGELIVGAVLDLSPSGTDDLIIPIGTNHKVVVLTVDVLASAATTTLVDFRDGLGTRQIKNILTNSTANSVAPSLVDTTLPIKSFKPVITRPLAGNSGQAGTEFSVKVSNLAAPGVTSIAVEVCGVALVRDDPQGFKLLPDNQTLTIIAPACGTGGFAPLTVTTDFGSDTEPNGFNYLTPQPPEITQLVGNEGQAGKVFQVVGNNFNTPGLAVKVCGTAATAVLRGDNVTIDVTAPACALGFAALEVCTDDGCDSEANGFNYVDTVQKTFIRGDASNDLIVDISDAVSIFGDLFLGQPAGAICRDALDADDSGVLDITDGVSVLLFLFQAGTLPKPPYPEAGVDPTEPDEIGICQ